MTIILIGWRGKKMDSDEPLLRVNRGLYKPVPIPGVRDGEGNKIYMFIRMGEVEPHD